MPTEIGAISDFKPIIEYLMSNIEPSCETLEFKRGCVHLDFINHLLIGNDVVGKVGIDAIADCLLAKQLRTLYLAGERRNRGMQLHRYS